MGEANFPGLTQAQYDWVDIVLFSVNYIFFPEFFFFLLFSLKNSQIGQVFYRQTFHTD